MAEEIMENATPTQQEVKPVEEKLFTQADMDRVVQERIARERKNMPSEDELKEFKAYKASKQSDAERMSELNASVTAITGERDSAIKERDEAAKKRDSYKASNDTLKGENAKLSADLAEARAKITKFERETFLASKGVPSDMIGYYSYEIGQLVTEEKTFEAASEEFLKEHPFTKIKVDTGADLSGGNGVPSSTNEQMNQIFRKARR